MARYTSKYKPVHVGVSIVDKEAYQDYRKFSKIRDPKKFDYYAQYRKVVRSIWKKVALASIEYEGGVYAKRFFYIVPQVIANMPFAKNRFGKIITNFHTDGDIYTPVFCNLLPSVAHSCWTPDGCFFRSYTEKLVETINKYVPKYDFLLLDLLRAKL